MDKPRGIFILEPEYFHLIYSSDHLAAIQQVVDVQPYAYSAPTILNNLTQLEHAELIFSGWGAPTFTRDVLEAAPALKIVFYGAGSVRGVVTDAFWKRGLRISSAWGANAIPVVEYTMAQITLCLKKAFFHASQVRQTKTWIRLDVPGAYQSTIGIISLGMIGRLLVERLKTFDLKILAYDPFVNEDEACRMGVELTSLDDLFMRSDVISLHTPWLPQTERMIQARHFDLMKPGAAFINTARGAVVDEPGMIEVLERRSDLFAVLDVTFPEPPEAESKLFILPNIFLTPHIAGSMGQECWRMGQVMVDELGRYLDGMPLKFEINQERAINLA